MSGLQFREKKSDEEIESGGSDDEKWSFKQMLSSRLKAIPKRRSPLQNGSASTQGNGTQIAEQTSQTSANRSSIETTGGRIWSDTVMMQSLEDKMGTSAGPGTSINELQNRGSETYALRQAKRKHPHHPRFSGVQKKKPRRAIIPAEKFVPHQMLAPNFGKKKLLETDFDPDALSEEQLVNGLTEALGEQVPEVIRLVVKCAGKQLSVALFKKCQEVEKRGGMLTQRGNRRRTPGGVFMQLFNECEEVSEEQKKAIQKFGTEMQRKSGRYPKWWDKRDQKKKSKNGKTVNGSEENKPSTSANIETLPRSNELIKPVLTDLIPSIQTEFAEGTPTINTNKLKEHADNYSDG